MATNVTPSLSPTSWMTAIWGCSRRRRRGPPASSRARRFGVVDQFFGQDLERHLAPEIHVDRAVDDAHAAAADLFEDLVVREFPAGHGISGATGSRAPIS